MLRLLLFWGMFLPLEAVYSVDSALNQTAATTAKKIFSAATIALILQICFIYWFSALLKNHPIWWQEGTATYYALSLDYIRTGFGQFLLNFPALLTLATFVTLRIEILGPLLIFFPFNTALFRTIAIFLFCGLHLGFASSLHLGLFPFVCCAAWLSLLPTEVWEFLSKRYQLEKTSKLEIYYDQDCGFCKKVVYLIRTFFILPGATLAPAQPHPEIYQEMQAMNSWVVRGINGRSYFRFEGITYLASCSPVFRLLSPLLEWAPVSALGNKAYQWVANHRKQASVITKPLNFSPLKIQLLPSQSFFVWVSLIVVAWWNLNTISPTQFPVPNEVKAFARVLGIYQKWDLFAPYPTTRDGWLVIPGILQDGGEVDIYNNGQPVSWDKPDNVSATYKDPQWRKYLTHLYGEKNEDRRLYYGQYLCRTWNAAHAGDDYLTQFQIYFMLERTPPPGQTPEIERVSLWRHTCAPQAEK